MLRWCPVTRDPPPLSSASFPSALVLQHLAQVEAHVFPVPRIHRPSATYSSSSRSRTRATRSLAVWGLANEFITTVNHMSCGHCRMKHTSALRRERRACAPTEAAPRPTLLPDHVSLAQTQFQKVALREASRLQKARRVEAASLPPLIGAQCVAKLLKTEVKDRYSVSVKSHNQIPMKAAFIDEPAVDSAVVPMLHALPPEEREFYSAEMNVIDWTGKSQGPFDEIQERFSFVGGTYDEYLSYYQRPDLPDNMWDFASSASVKAVAGFSVVPKKDGAFQRKLLMQCSTNYAWCSGKTRSDFGLLGGTALASCHVPSDVWTVAVSDESAAFTSVLTPEWMWAWSCCPPIRRQDMPARCITPENQNMPQLS